MKFAAFDIQMVVCDIENMKILYSVSRKILVYGKNVRAEWRI